MSRNSSYWINDVVAAGNKIVRYTTAMDRPTFSSDELVQDAVIRNIEIIGEAAKKLLDGVREQLPSIEWKKIAGMRDWLAHVYFNVDDDIICDVVTNKVPDPPRQIGEVFGEHANPSEG